MLPQKGEGAKTNTAHAAIKGPSDLYRRERRKRSFGQTMSAQETVFATSVASGRNFGTEKMLRVIRGDRRGASAGVAFLPKPGLRTRPEGVGAAAVIGIEDVVHDDVGAAR